MRRSLSFGMKLVALPVLLTGAFSCGGAGNGGQSAPGDPVVAEVAGQKFRLSDFLLYLKEMKPRADFWSFSAEQRKAVVEEFVQRKLWARHAAERGLDREGEIKARVDFLSDGTLGQAVRQRIFDELGASEEELKAYYEEYRDQFTAPPRYRIQHLLYKSRRPAESALKKLQSGAAFTELASQKGKDPDLLIADNDWYSPQFLIPELAQQAEKLEEGKTAPLIQTSYGYHVLRMQDREPGGQLTLEQVRAQVELKVRQEKGSEAYREELQNARQRHGAQVFSESFVDLQPPGSTEPR